MILRSANKDAFSLAEVTVALSLAAFTLVAIFGLLPVGLDSSLDAIAKTAANSIISAAISDLRASHPNADSSDQFGIPIPNNATVAQNNSWTLYFNAEGTASRSRKADSRYRLQIKFLRADHAQAPVQAVLQITWPASAKEDVAQGAVELFCAIDRHR